MDIHQLKTFVAVARSGSITRASELVHLSQPAVSAHIKAVEDALGVTLFERTSRGMALTSDGQRLLSKAEQTLAAHQALMDEAQQSNGAIADTNGIVNTITPYLTSLYVGGFFAACDGTSCIANSNRVNQVTRVTE